MKMANRRLGTLTPIQPQKQLVRHHATEQGLVVHPNLMQVSNIIFLNCFFNTSISFMSMLKFHYTHAGAHKMDSRIIGVHVVCGTINGLIFYYTDQLIGHGGNLTVEVIR